MSQEKIQTKISKLMEKYSYIRKAKNDGGIYCFRCKLAFTNSDDIVHAIKQHVKEEKVEKIKNKIEEMCEPLTELVKEYRNYKYNNAGDIKPDEIITLCDKILLSCHDIIKKCDKINDQFEPNILFNITMRRPTLEERRNCDGLNWVSVNEKIRKTEDYFRKQLINAEKDKHEKELQQAKPIVSNNKFKKRIL